VERLVSRVVLWSVQRFGREAGDAYVAAEADGSSVELVVNDGGPTAGITLSREDVRRLALVLTTWGEA
jgi:hypothetical protein